MQLLSAEPETFFGCDVCRKSVIETAARETEVMKLISHNTRVLTKSSAFKMLHNKFPELSDDNASEILDNLQISARVRGIYRDPWKGKLTILRASAV